MMSRRPVRRMLPALVLVLAAALVLPLAGAFAARPALGDWLRVGGAALETWRVIPADGDPDRARIVRQGAAGPASRRVMAIFPRPSSAYDVAITQILSVFAAKEIDVEVLAVNFRKDPGRGAALLREAEAAGYDLVLSVGSETTAWLAETYRGGRLPVVSVCSKDPVQLGQTRAYDRGAGDNFAFTSLNMPVDVQFAYIAAALPGMANMAILVDRRNVSAVETQAKPMADYARARGLKVFEIHVERPGAAAAELAQLMPQAVAAMRETDPDLSRSMFWITGSTSVFREIETINAHAGGAPVLSVVPEVVTASAASAVMSIGISFDSNAHLAALYAVDVLLGRKRAGDLPVGIVSPPDIAINFMKAREIGLRVPFTFFERATYLYGYDGALIRDPTATAQADAR